MKRIVPQALTLLLLPLAGCKKPEAPTHLGAWAGENSVGQSFQLVLQRDGTGEMSNDRGRVSFQYDTDTTQTPDWIDFVITPEPGKEIRLKAIFELQNDSTMRLGTLWWNSPKERLRNFQTHNPVGDYLLIKKESVSKEGVNQEVVKPTP